ncbi:hypothetical protein JVU11DRAFT_5515 [Chiua virens]|nr:hypothetical protein JVU11DRAFT_5515 [Chiua virens]
MHSLFNIDHQHDLKWPEFDHVLVGSFDQDSSPSIGDSDFFPSTFPSAAELAAMPIPPSRSPPRNKNPDHIPRPRNAFMLFRSAFAAAQKISSNIEHDNRHITRIISYCWNRLSDAEKQVWRDKAAAEKMRHAERYPGYRFSPVGRTNKPIKRNVRRNGAEDVKRCEKLAELVMAGKCGQELENAIKQIDLERLTLAHSVATESNSTEEDKMPADSSQDVKSSDVPPFLTPLLPPTATSPQKVPDKNLLLEPSVYIDTTPHIDPQTFFSPAAASISDPGAGSLWDSPCHQYYYQLNMRDDMSPLGSHVALDPFQPVMDFVQSNHAQPEQMTQDISSLFSWNQSNNFIYYS